MDLGWSRHDFKSDLSLAIDLQRVPRTGRRQAIAVPELHLVARAVIQ